jgi:membrane-bound lytic murein transglycosylase D
MKRLFTFVICLLSLQIANALPAPINSRDTTFAHAAPLPLTGYEGTIERRLDSIKKDVPLDYNEFVQNYINTYLGNRDEMARVVGLSKYYFPIYEKVFREAGIPEEIKYLSIVESKLDPNAVSRVGATGPWQFMTTTAKLYGLNMDDYVDERRDPVRASHAAAAYLKDAYEEFGDWLLAIASYNCGKSSVEYAITKAGGANDFWSIRQYLPPETRNYVPAYIAVAYVMNYYSRHNIIPQACNFSMKMDTILVDRYVSLNSISGIMGMDISQLALLNPAYKRQIINGTSTFMRRLIIPQARNDKYAALYDALNNGPALIGRVKHEDNSSDTRLAYHKVREGETLASIADKYGVDEHDLKAWNHLRHSKAVVGQKLKLSAGEGDPDAPQTKHNHSYITYKVKPGDSLSVIAAKFDGASVEKIKSLNGLGKAALQPGMTLKISRG